MLILWVSAGLGEKFSVTFRAVFEPTHTTSSSEQLRRAEAGMELVWFLVGPGGKALLCPISNLSAHLPSSS